MFFLCELFLVSILYGVVGWHHRFNGHELWQTLGDGENREAWCAAIHGVAKNWTRLGS